MGYRDAVPRKKRLWFVTLAYHGNTDGHATNFHAHDWVWALEADEAVAQARATRKISVDDVWSFEAVCGEDFAERELKGAT